MSTEETAKDESEMANKLQDGESKQQKDKKNRKEKVKPFAKVAFAGQHRAHSILILFNLLAGCNSTSSSNDDRRGIC